MEDFEDMDPIQTITKVLEKHCDFIYLLGSLGTSRFSAHSDIDLAVFWKNDLDSERVVDLIGQLEDSFGRDVDLVSLNRIDPIFARQVLATGRLIYVDRKAAGILLKWKMEKMSEYPDFKRTRKIIEDHLLKRKKYF